LFGPHRLFTSSLFPARACHNHVGRGGAARPGGGSRGLRQAGAARQPPAAVYARGKGRTAASTARPRGARLQNDHHHQLTIASPPPPLSSQQSRDARHKNADDVALYGSLLLKHHRATVLARGGEEELWLLHEQTAAALLEAGCLTQAVALIKAVLERWPDSRRARRLQGMYYEAASQWDKAEAVYESMLDADPADEAATKRLAALSRSRGDPAGAAAILRTYLDHFQGDLQAWEELCELYCEAGALKQAAFCAEEAILLAPGNPAAHLRYADLLYSLGGAEQCRTARSYYSKALQLSGGRNPRAIIGLLATTGGGRDPAAGAVEAPAGDAGAAVAAAASTTDRASLEQLPATAAELLREMYRDMASPVLRPLMEAMLVAQGHAGLAAVAGKGV
jgi:ER membrane protein complex subunit 2